MRVSDIMMGEWNALIKEKRLLWVLLLLPIAYMFLFGSMYGAEKVRGIPTLYIDEDRSQLSQQIIQSFSASESFQLTGQAHSEKELLQAVQTGNATIGIIIPDHLEEKIKQGKPGELMTVMDGSNLLVLNSGLTRINEIVQTISGSITVKRLEANGLPPDHAMSIQMGYRMFFNPGMSYKIFMPLGLLGAVVQQVIFLGIVLCLTREKEQGTWERLLIHWKEPWIVFYAKSLPYFLLGLFTVITTLGILKDIYHVPFLGNPGAMFALSALFVLSLMGIGYLLSVALPDSLQATQISMLIALPSLLLSGYVWPFMAMPGVLVKIGECLPLTYFLRGMREIAIKGNGWDSITGDIQALAVISLVTIALALLVFSAIGFKHTRSHRQEQEVIHAKSLPM